MLTNGSHPYRRESNEGDLVVCKKQVKKLTPRTRRSRKLCAFLLQTKVVQTQLGEVKKLRNFCTQPVRNDETIESIYRNIKNTINDYYSLITKKRCWKNNAKAARKVCR